MRKEYKLKGLDCANCAAKLEAGLNKIKDYDDVIVNFMSQKLIIESSKEIDEKKLQKDIENIKQNVTEIFKSKLLSAKTFKVEAKRADKKFHLKSPEICMETGGAILSKFNHLKVDVHNPDVTVNVDIRETKAYQLDIEIKSVNQRFLDVQIRSPKILNFIENDFRQLIKQQLSRGRIEVFVNLAYIGKNEKQIVINWELIDSLITQLTDGIQQRYGSQNQVSIRRLAERFALDENFVTVEEKPEESMEELAQLALDTLKSALDSIEASREKEGQALASVLKKNTEEFKQVLKKLNSFVDVYEQEFQLRYQKKLEEFLGAKVDEQRLLTELAILLERGDIHEELDRLAIHVQKLDELIEAQCPVGRELDFLIQEMNREINTIGSKSNAIEIKNQVVQSKTILEKIREQVQNIE